MGSNRYLYEASPSGSSVISRQACSTLCGKGTEIGLMLGKRLMAFFVVITVAVSVFLVVPEPARAELPPLSLWVANNWSPSELRTRLDSLSPEEVVADLSIREVQQGQPSADGTAIGTFVIKEGELTTLFSLATRHDPKVAFISNGLFGKAGYGSYKLVVLRMKPLPPAAPVFGYDAAGIWGEKPSDPKRIRSILESLDGSAVAGCLMTYASSVEPLDNGAARAVFSVPVDKLILFESMLRRVDIEVTPELLGHDNPEAPIVVLVTSVHGLLPMGDATAPLAMQEVQS